MSKRGLHDGRRKSDSTPDERAMSRQYKCGNCDFVTDDLSEVHEVVSHIEDRVAPGEVMPHGECPKCGALVHEQVSRGGQKPRALRA